MLSLIWLTAVTRQSVGIVSNAKDILKGSHSKASFLDWH